MRPLTEHIKPDLLVSAWKAAQRVPGGKALFSKAIGRVAPYTGSIGATVVSLRAGFARVELRDRRAVRNHLGSVHAIALANFAEKTTGLAMLSGLPENTRGILSGLTMEYLKKGRGTLVAECTAPRVTTNETARYEVVGEIRDGAGLLVARGTATWQVGPTRP
jgi:acyl-coenzyme A thioesterase PaaI-like protein